VAIVDDNASLRNGLTMILNTSPGFECTQAFANAEDALQGIATHPPDVVLMDINLPRLTGIDCVRRLTRQLPTLQVIMLTIEEDSRRVFESLEAGATGYLVKNVPPAQILTAIEEAHRGGSPMSSQVARLVVQSFRRRGPSAEEDENLTPREEEVLQFIAKGYRSKEVADALEISTQTVETHLRNIYHKLHVRSRAAAVARFLGQAPGKEYPEAPN
jgi:DNA-binding NarL/FixJ family response regulator